MLIQFPDGIMVDTKEGVAPILSRPAANIAFLDGLGVVGATVFYYYNELEGVSMLQQIIAGLKSKVENLVLTSSSPLPTALNVAVTDMYPNNSAVTPTVVVGGAFAYLTVGNGALNIWPRVQNGPAMTACFRPEATVTIGGAAVTQLEYINGVTLLFKLPYLPVGVIYPMTYTDSRGSVTKLASFQY